jgi:carboxymethylenebutenolidase
MYEEVSQMQTFEYKGTTFNGHLSIPSSGKGSGVLLFHAWWGLNDFFIQTCDRLAQAGFLALALDYYRGQVAETIEEAQALARSLDRKSVKKTAVLAVDYLASLPSVTSSGLATIGFSLGAGFAIEMTRARPRKVTAVVLFYGTGGGKFDKTSASFLGNFAENDPFEDAASVKSLADRIRSVGREATFYTYPATGHWFVETDRPEYNPKATSLAWDRTIDFLRKKLE